MTAEQATNRGFNLMLTAILILTGIAFFSGGVRENDFTDKLDDAGLLAVGILLLIWYLIGQNRFSRSWVPVALVLLALPIQVYGLVNEFNDKEAVGNDYGGMFIYVPLVVFTLYQFWRRPKFEAASPGGAAAPETLRSGTPT